MSGSRRPGRSVSPEPVRRDFARLTAIFEQAHEQAVRGQARALCAGQRRTLIARLQRSLATAATVLNRIASAGDRRAARRSTRPGSANRKA